MSRYLRRGQSTGDFRSYLAAGETHTIPRSPLFYSEQSGGGPFAEWLGALLAKEAPSNSDFENCLAAPPGYGF